VEPKKEGDRAAGKEKQEFFEKSGGKGETEEGEEVHDMKYTATTVVKDEVSIL